MTSTSITITVALFFVGLLAAFAVDHSRACNCEMNLPADPLDALGPWHQRHLECGIPPFAYRLPQDAQAKINAIWAKYEPGEDCEEEQIQTRNVVMSIPEEIRFAVFKGVCGPGFLINATEAVKEPFRKVWFDEATTIEQKQAEFKKLADSLLTGPAKKKFERFDQILADHIRHRTEFLASLSAPAKEAYTKWSAMRRDERKFLAALSPEIRAELGLTCKCCGSCKTGGKTVGQSRATRAVKYELRTEAQMLFDAAGGAACSY